MRLNKSAFTLIELLVVIAIIGILATLVAINLGGARQKARDTQRKNDVKQIASALEAFYSDSTNGYPATLASLAPKYIGALPADPSSGSSYNYTVVADANLIPNQAFRVWATLENTKDPDGVKTGGTACSDSGTCFVYVCGGAYKEQATWLECTR